MSPTTQSVHCNIITLNTTHCAYVQSSSSSWLLQLALTRISVSTMVNQRVRTEADLDYSSSKKYVVGKITFAPQYAQLYFCRLCTLRSAATEAAQRRWGSASGTLKYANRIVDIRSDTKGVDTVVAGIVFRVMGSKPSILREYNASSEMMIPPPPSQRIIPYESPDDKVVIEDENGRCALDVSALPRTRAFTSGIVLSVRGREDATRGVFVVSDFVTLGPPPQRAPPSLSADKFVAFVSAPRLGPKHALATELLIEFLRGNVGDADTAASIVQLVVAGPLLAHNATDPTVLLQDTPNSEVAPMVELDRFLTDTAAVVPVAVVPGLQDPVNHLLPQQPLHRCLLPTASRSTILHRAPNPLAYKVDGRLVVGSAGQPVSDFVLYGGLPVASKEEVIDDDSKSRAVAVLDSLETMLASRHIAPTCPDTLASYPFSMEDPFILDECPHILFAGNQANFSTRLFKSAKVNSVKKVKMETGNGKLEHDVDAVDVECRLLGLPRFYDTGRIVLVNLRTLHCSVQEFGDSL